MGSAVQGDGARCQANQIRPRPARAGGWCHGLVSPRQEMPRQIRADLPRDSDDDRFFHGSPAAVRAGAIRGARKPG